MATTPIILTGTQSKWKDSFASSAQVRLTLRVNGEEEGTIITPDATITKAGIVAPTVAIPAATIVATANKVPYGYYYYVYVYASSKYPFVENAVTGGGQLYPRSSPSPVAVEQYVASPSIVTVTLTKSTRTDMDKIWIYRTANGLTSDAASAASAAGEYFYVGSVDSNGVAGTTTFADGNAANTGEILELDNYVCPLFRYTVFDGSYWWGWGNVAFSQPCTLDGTTNVTLTGTDVNAQWFSGRDGSVCNFNGLISGGFDGKGSFYFKRLTINTGELYSDAELTIPAIAYATGATTISIQTNPTTLYRSKLRNPFSWGKTTTFITDDGTTQVPELYALKFGGGTGTAISLIPNERTLKLDCEGPTRSYALDLTAADGDTFAGTLRTLDETHSVGAHFSQFPACTPTGQSVLVAIDPKNRQILQADSGSQIPLSTNVIRTLRKMVTDDLAPEFFHGVYNHDTELNCWWIKAIPEETPGSIGEDSPMITHMLYQHAPTGKWGVMPDFGVLCSATIYDPVENQTYTFVGTQEGIIAKAFVKDVFQNQFTGERFKTGTVVAPHIGGDLGITSELEVTLLDLTAGGDSSAVTLTPHGLSVGDKFYLHTEGLSFTPGWGTVNDVTSTTTFFFDHLYSSTGVQLTATYYGSESGITAYRALNLMPYPQEFGWFYFIPPAGGESCWAYCGISGSDLYVRFYVPEDLSEITETPPITLSGCTWYAGMIPCQLRRYFNAGNPEKSKRLIELWATQQSVTSQFVRFYTEYETDIAASITLTRDKQGDNVTNSNVYLNKNQIPSNLKNSFGVEFLEVGYTGYELMDFTLKLNPS